MALRKTAVFDFIRYYILLLTVTGYFWVNISEPTPIPIPLNS